MAFTAGEIASIANASLDFYFDKGRLFHQSMQDKPLIAALEGKAKTFPGGKGEHLDRRQGHLRRRLRQRCPQGLHPQRPGEFLHSRPTSSGRTTRGVRHHIGLTLTHTELKIDGISVVDTNGESTRKHSRREMTALVDLLEDKLEDLGEQYLRGLDNMFHGDGVADPLGFAGIGAIITANPAVGVVGGIDAAINTWWRNRAATTAAGGAGGQAPIASSPANGGVLAQFLQTEWRQLRRYGGRPDLCLAGSAWIGALEGEYRANGYYTDNGFNSGTDMSVGDLRFKNVGIKYDPWLDDHGMTKRAYFIDTSAIFLEKMEGEWRRNHTPARPADQFVLFRSITSTGQVVATRRNSSAVYDIA